MALAGTIIFGIVLLLGLLNGLRRGAIKEGILLIAVLLGALLVTLWSQRGGDVIARRMSWQPGTGQWLAAMGLLWGVVLGTGYAPASLLPQRPGKMLLPLRVAGAALGFLNAGLLIAFSLLYTQTMFYDDAAPRETLWLRTGAISRFLLEQFDLLLLGLAWSIAVISLVAILGRLIIRLISPSRATPPAPARPAPAKPSLAPQPASPIIRDTVPTPVAPGMERSFIEKPRSTPGSDRPEAS